MICVLESFFGKVSFSLDFDVERFGNVRHDEIDQTTDAENDVLMTANNNIYYKLLIF